jgi:hypothetical protein
VDRRVSFHWQLGLLVSVAFGAYLHWATSRFSFDAVAYCSLIHYALFGGGVGVLAHPSHMLYSPMGWAVARSLVSLGIEVDVLALMRLLNATATAATLWFFGGVLRRTSGRPGLALAVTAVLGASFVVWYYATDPEVYPFALLCLVLALRSSLASLDADELWPVIATGVWIGVGVGFHVSTILILPGIAGALYARGRDRGTRVVRPALLLLVAGVLSLAPYVAYYWGWQDTDPLQAMGRFLVSEVEDRATHDDRFRPGVESMAVVRGLVAEPEVDGVVLRLSVAAARLALVVAAVIALVRVRRLWSTHRWSCVIVSCWLLLSFLLYSWYQAGARKFVGFLLVPLLVLIALALSTLPRQRWVTAAVAVWAGVVGVTNLVGVIVPYADPRTNPHLGHTSFIEAHSADRDLVIFLGYGDSLMQRVYLPFFGHRRGLALADVCRRSPGESARLLEHRIATARRSGGRVLVWSDVVDDPALVRRFEAWRSLPDGSVDDLIGRYDPVPLVADGHGRGLWLLTGGAELGR